MFDSDSPALLSLFWDEDEMASPLPCHRQEKLLAPYYEGSAPFDPAFDMLCGSMRVYDAARAFAESIVTDGDLRSARDPIWTYNARTLLLNVYMARVCLWEYLHECEAGRKPFPSLTDTIFRMVDDLALSRMKTGEQQYRDGTLSYPEWWKLIGVAEQEFIRNTILGAPMNTAGSLLAVVNSYTGSVTNAYSASKSDALFEGDTPCHVRVHLPSINTQTLNIVLSSAATVWGRDMKVCAHGLSSWSKSFVSVFAEFIANRPFKDDSLLITSQGPVQELAPNYNGSTAWGAKPSVNALTFFRKCVEETTGNQNGLLTALPVESPDRLTDDAYMVQSDEGWELLLFDTRLITRAAMQKPITLTPVQTEQSIEIQRLRNLFATEASRRSPLWERDGTLFVSFPAIENELLSKPEESTENDGEKIIDHYDFEIEDEMKEDDRPDWGFIDKFFREDDGTAGE